MRILPAVFVRDVLFLSGILVLRAHAQARGYPRMRRALTLLAVYVTFETFGHVPAEEGAAIVMRWLGL